MRSRAGGSGLKRLNLQCVVCGRSGFSKAEHLKRHELSHTGLKSFKCPRCSKQFSRKDSLRRHQRGKHSSQLSPSFATDIAQSDERHRLPAALDETDADRIGLSALVAAAERDEGGEEVPSMSMEMGADAARDIHTISQGQQEAYDITNDFAFHLRDDTALHTPWLESDDIFSMLLRDDPAWPIEPQSQQPHVSSPCAALELVESGSSMRAQQAMKHMTALLHDLSFNLAEEVESTGVTSEFLDTCANAFFDCFVPIFPVCHQPTFSLKDCSHPALLNMIALGSLWVAESDALSRGEALWRLAHAAVATSWQGMMSHLSQGDMNAGVQLVMTALLGQSYAVLSQSQSSRLTSQIFHSLGFYWARQCGLPVTAPFTDVPSVHDAYDVKRQKWKLWAAQETRHRISLGHYILDGLISQSSGSPTGDRHLTNKMILPSSPQAYEAATVDAWIEAMERYPQQSLEFREVYLRLFNLSAPLEVDLSPFATSVVLEGIQSVISDYHEAGGASIGTPDRLTVSRAMWRLLDSQSTLSRRSPGVCLDLIIRWHTICIEVCVDTSQLIHNLCDIYSVKQNLYNGRASRLQQLQMEAWIGTRAARRALLHASAIMEILPHVAVGRMRALNIPLATFISAITFLAWCLAGRTRLALPSNIDWRSVCELDFEHNLGVLSQNATSTDIFLALPDASLSTSTALGPPKHLLYSVNSLQKVLESLSSTWGIGKEMSVILVQLLSACRTNPTSSRNPV